MDRLQAGPYKRGALGRPAGPETVAGSLMQASTFPSALQPDLKDSKVQRQTMVDCQIRTFEVTDQLVIERFASVPRERFLPDAVRDLAYSDIGFSIPAAAPGEETRYLLPPLILARLIQGGRVGAQDRVLDIAGGTGYAAAILSGLAATVVALEATPTLRDGLQARLTAAGLHHVAVRGGPLGAGVDGPFDVILVNGAIETGLESLFACLAEGGRLLTIQRFANDPTGRAAKAMRFEKSNGEVSGRILFDASAPVLAAFKKTPAFVF